MAAARGIDFQPEELVRVNGVGGEFQLEVLAELRGEIEDFAFQNLEMLQGDVEEVAGAAGGVEHRQAAEPVVEGVDHGAGLLEVAGAGVGDGGGADVFPLGAERFDDGGQHEAFDVGARGEVRAELVALVRVQARVRAACRRWRVRRLPNAAGRLP